MLDLLCSIGALKALLQHHNRLCCSCIMHDAFLHKTKRVVAAGEGPAGGPQVPPQMMEEMQKHLSNPATADMITTFVQTMKPEDLAGILKQSGMDVTPEQVQSHSTSSIPWLIYFSVQSFLGFLPVCTQLHIDCSHHCRRVDMDAYPMAHVHI